MLLEPGFVQDNLRLVLGLAAAIALVKGLLCAGIGRAFGYRNVVPLALGLTMFQAGEFAFVIGRVGLATESIGPDLYSLIMAVTLVTMFLTPFVSRATAPIYAFVKKRRQSEPVLTINISHEELHDHVILAGAGHTGRAVAGVVGRLGLPSVAIELDQHRLESCREAGLAVIYGDASHPLVLEAAGLTRACVLLITTPSSVVTQTIARHARQLKPELHIIARAETERLAEELHELGVHEVVLPQMEAGLEMTRQALLHLQVPDQQIERFADEVRSEFYRPLSEAAGFEGE
jgi:CPA2 family monovalent cation:H+ antiporter-2